MLRPEGSHGLPAAADTPLEFLLSLDCMSTVESGHLTSVTRLFSATAAIELGAGLALLVAPAVAIQVIYGSAVDVFPAVGIARVTGAALISLGAACWWARDDGRSAASRALLGGILIYNVVVVGLCFIGALGALGPLQWAAIVLHGALALWCARVGADQRR